MIKVGMMIADRYEIIEKIGTGGMSDVYRAKDHKLNRFVAVKVLKQEFSENTDFVSKFRTEAQAAAGLMHPNIVNVYDVGEETGFHYIVMELVEGITLKKYIEKKARLSVKEAVSIAIQVSMGIESAHNNHIIHRDIKPQNIIISKEGKVKVTDFGIAKAATSNTITSNVMGSVHYTSPEQVRGGFSDEKSDIYSLGITLFEMLTGRVPFNGDTTVAVAIKHIQEPMPSPRDFVPEVPISVEQIVLKCTQKSTDKRYQNVPELIDDLKRSLISPDENFVKIDGNDNLGATRTISAEEIKVIKDQSQKREDFDSRMNVASTSVPPVPKKVKTATNDYSEKYDSEQYDDEQYVEEAYDDYSEEWEEVEEYEPVKKSSGKKNASKNSKGSTANKNSGKNSKSGKNAAKTTNKNAAKNSAKNVKNKNKKYDKYDEDDYDPKMEFLTTILIVIAAVVVGCIFLYIVAKAVGISIFGTDNVNDTVKNEITQVKMVAVVGSDANEAEEKLKTMGLDVKREYQTSKDVELNHVISSSVQEGATLYSGDTVTLVISSGEDSDNNVTVPSVVGLSKAEATAKLESEGFVVTTRMENSDTVAKNEVIAQSPEAGESSVRNASIELVISLGAESVEVSMPNLMNVPITEARSMLAEAGLSIDDANITQEYSNDVAFGNVCYQNYNAGITINSSSEIVLKVSLGPEMYDCITEVKAPADYVGGAATVTLKGSNGVQLYSATKEAFPVPINITGISGVPSGELYITYYVNEEEQLTDGDGNVTIHNVQVQKTLGPETITFTKAQ